VDLTFNKSNLNLNLADENGRFNRLINLFSSLCLLVKKGVAKLEFELILQ